jgi:predicted nucleotidyltransferase component of viral defense system
MNSKKELLALAKANDYKPEILEKVQKLLFTLEQFMAVPNLRDRLVLKGGTALNLFHFENIPRLSVDIDLNYIGQLNREDMLQERPIINDAIQQILEQHQFQLYRNPAKQHAGSKMVWRYQSVLGQMGNLEIDINYMYRQPLFPIEWLASKLNTASTIKFPVLDLHELAAGKLAALFSRKASRDFFDAHFLLTKCTLIPEKLRLAFVVYLAMTSLDITTLDIKNLGYDITDIHNKLLPVLQQKNLPRASKTIDSWANSLLQELREALSILLPLGKNEIEFIRNVREGKIKPELLTDDEAIVNVIAAHPALEWAAKRTMNI